MHRLWGGSQLDSTLKGPPESKHVCLFLQHSEGRNKVGGGCGVWGGGVQSEGGATFGFVACGTAETEW